MSVMMILGTLSLVVVLTCALAKQLLNVELLRQLQVDTDQGKDIDELFATFKHIFHSYYIDEYEESKRKQIFANKVKFIRQHNALYAKGEKSYTLGLNQFSDLTHQEFREMYTFERWSRNNPPRYANTHVPPTDIDVEDDYENLKSPEFNMIKKFTNLTDDERFNMYKNMIEVYYKKKKDGFSEFPSYIIRPFPTMAELPDTVDWKKKGFVTGIKDQADCGSCWAFGTVGSLEGQMFKKTGQLVSLSVQQLVDCDMGNNGCVGGNEIRAFAYIRNAGGLHNNTDYPYLAKDSHCKFNASFVVPGTRVSEIVVIESGNELSLKEAVASVGPISVDVDIHPEEVQSYSGGIFYEPSCESSNQDLDHAVLVIGYGTSPQDYWLIKNSMGESWGEQGYMKLARNKENHCGIATQAVYPLVEDLINAHAQLHFTRKDGLILITLINIRLLVI